MLFDKLKPHFLSFIDNVKTFNTIAVRKAEELMKQIPIGDKSLAEVIFSAKYEKVFNIYNDVQNGCCLAYIYRT